LGEYDWAVTINFVKDKTVLIIGGMLLTIGISLVAVSLLMFSAPQPKSDKEEVFTIAGKPEESAIVDKLKSQGFIRNTLAFNLVLTIKGKHNKIESGGYFITKNLNAWQVADK
jgi:cell division protein YceG involved in septum cleavage